MFGRDATDKYFSRFCRTGEPEALGEVFDRTSARLMRVALWLTRERADAEDVLQRTFLQAIETRGQFQQGKSALPWLMGLLGNQARKVRREHDRCQISSVQPDCLASSDDDPSSRELEAWLCSVGKDLGEPYDGVLRLHIEHGLNAKEIAACLGRPAGTVRTQLVRVMRQIRTRIPAGFANSRSALVLPIAGLEPMRATIIKSAGSASLSAGGTIVGSTLASLALHKVLIAVPVAIASLVAWSSVPGGASSASSGGVVPASVQRSDFVMANRLEDLTAEDRKPTGDPDHDELRRWVLEESTDFLIEKRLMLLLNLGRYHRRDRVLWFGAMKISDEIMARPDYPNRKVAAAAMAQMIELADVDIRPWMEHRIKPLRDVSTRNNPIK